MAAYGQFCPIALAAEVVAERWTPLILREIVLADSRRFGEIQRGVGPISQSLLVERLRSLEAAGVIERRPNPASRGWEYHPTQAGRDMEPLLEALAAWSQRWMELRREDCDPAYVMTAVHQLLRTERFPARPITIRFDFMPDVRTYWLILDRRRPELCFHDPGHEVELFVTADQEALARVVLGRLGIGEAMAAGQLTVAGPSELVRQFPGWIGLSRWAPYAAELAAVTRQRGSR